MGSGATSDSLLTSRAAKPRDDFSIKDAFEGAVDMGGNAESDEEEYDGMADMCDTSSDEESTEWPSLPTASAMRDAGRKRWSVPKVPSRMPKRSKEDMMMDENGIFVSVDFAESNINGAEDEIELTVALDSGAVDHVLASEHLPTSAEVCEVTGARVGKSFVAANGQPMRTFGEVILECEDGQGKTAASFAVTEVSRALQSVSRICDQDLEVLFTKREAKVRDPKSGKFIATYPRRGGLYTRTVKARAGRKPAPAAVERRASPFPRQR